MRICRSKSCAMIHLFNKYIYIGIDYVKCPYICILFQVTVPSLKVVIGVTRDPSYMLILVYNSYWYEDKRPNFLEGNCILWREKNDIVLRVLPTGERSVQYHCIVCAGG